MYTEQLVLPRMMETETCFASNTNSIMQHCNMEVLKLSPEERLHAITLTNTGMERNIY